MAGVGVGVHGELLFVGEAAAMLGRSEQAVRYQMDKGRIPWAKVAGRIVIRKSDLEALIDAEFSKAASA